MICCLDNFFLGAAPPPKAGEPPLVTLLLMGEVFLLFGFLFPPDYLLLLFLFCFLFLLFLANLYYVLLPPEWE